MRLRGVGHDPQPVTGHGEAEFGRGRVAVGEQPFAEGRIGPRACHDPGAVHRGGVGKEPGEHLVEFIVGGQTSGYHPLLQPPYPRGHRQFLMSRRTRHGTSSR